VHNVRDTLAELTRIPVEKIRVRTGDVGGSFGLKIGAYREDVACAAASKQLGRPVKWIEDRSEHMAASGHAREESFDVEVSFTDAGKPESWGRRGR
jgi:carbon-monoxide dehydrogenase large subunit